MLKIWEPINKKVKNTPSTVFINWENKVVKVINNKEKEYKNFTEEEYIEYFKKEIYDEIIKFLDQGEEEKESRIREE